MASQNPTDGPAAEGAAAPQALPDRTANPADNQTGESKNAAKKAAKAAKLKAEKAEKKAGANKGEKAPKPEAKKAPKKKAEGPPLIGIDAKKDTEFPEWYQQTVVKSQMLDFYDVSGCYILKVSCEIDQDRETMALIYIHCIAHFVLHLGGDPGLVQQEDQEHWCQELLIPSVRIGGCPAT
jgi:chemotaxis protein histidine kinase CheA